MSILYSMLGGLTWASSKVGTPLVKGAKWASGKTPKSVKKFGTKSKKFVGKEYKEMKSFAKEYPELFVGSVALGGATGYGLKKGYQAITNGKKKNKKKGFV